MWALVSLFASSAHALPEDPGMVPFSSISRTVNVGGRAVASEFFVPKVSSPAPVVVVGHGFQRSKANMVGWGKLLAGRGYLAAVPTFPGGLLADHKVNGAIMAGLIGYMVGQSKTAGSGFSGRVDGSRTAVVGLSAGGQAAILAAAADASIDLVVGLDPVDSFGLSAAAASSVKAPLVVLRGPPHSCNAFNNIVSIFNKFSGPRLMLQVNNASHCDPEDPSGPLCTLVCGATHSKRLALFRRYTMAALDHRLRCRDQSAWLGGSAAKGDTGVSGITASVFPPAKLGCVTADGGPSKDAAADRGALPDAPSVTDRGAASRDRDPGLDQAVNVETQPGCGCSTSGGPSWPCWLVLVLLWRRSRRR